MGGDIMSKRKRKEMRMSDSTQLFITEFMLPKIKLEPAEKKIKLEVKEEKD
jgi:hypothetical protein